ncbi:MAG: pyridoxal phosphate-dependent aminotransferase [Bacteroidales bacterium]|nr:pyridoxal phosphate-dependent aminotransferase [Bacteroidales bacterium]
MYKVSDRLNKLSISETLAMTDKSRQLQAKGIDIINLSIGEPDFNTPEVVKKAAQKAIDDNFTHYTPVQGFSDLRQAISDKFKNENNLDYAPDQIIVSTGAKQSLANVILSLVNKDEEVLIPAPFWVSYSELVKLAEAKSVIIKTKIENKFKVTPEQIEQAITPKTKLFLFNSPSNPTGSLYSKEELKAIADVFAKHKEIFILSDEIYEHINFQGKHESIAQFENIKDQVVVVNGVSKAYAMTGWRIGYIGAPKWIAQACNKLQGQMTSGASSISQKAACAALNTGLDTVYEMREVFKKRRDLVYKLLSEIKGIKTFIPDGAFYFFPDVTYFFGKSVDNITINNAGDLCMYLLNNAHVATVTGSAFGDPNCIRLSYATSEDNIIEALKRIKTALDKLN